MEVQRKHAVELARNGILDHYVFHHQRPNLPSTACAASTNSGEPDHFRGLKFPTNAGTNAKSFPRTYRAASSEQNAFRMAVQSPLRSPPTAKTRTAAIPL